MVLTAASISIDVGTVEYSPAMPLLNHGMVETKVEPVGERIFAPEIPEQYDGDSSSPRSGYRHSISGRNNSHFVSSSDEQHLAKPQSWGSQAGTMQTSRIPPHRAQTVNI